jgi:hypothetical protein
LTRDEIDLEIRRFLEDHCTEGIPNFTDLIIYYTGHADFTKGEQNFQLILRSSNYKIVDSAGYTMRQLAATVNAAARKACKLVILDCCYAAGAFQDWQRQGVDDVKVAISRQAANNFPANAENYVTALICACDDDKWALYKDNELTAFTRGLMGSLLSGDHEHGDKLTIGDVYELTKRAILVESKNEAVAPLLHVPKGQREDLIARALFPNPARRIELVGLRMTALENAVSEFRVTDQVNILRGIDSSLLRYPRSEKRWMMHYSG